MRITARYLAAALMCVPALLAGASSIVPPPIANVQDCIDTRLPVPRAAQEQDTPPYLFVVVRVLHPDMERRVLVTISQNSANSPLRMSIQFPEGTSIGNQLAELKSSDPSSELGQFCNKIKIQSISKIATGQTIKHLLGELENLKIPARPPDELIIHGVATDIYISTWTGFLAYNYIGEKWEKSRKLPPVQAWVRSLFEYIDSELPTVAAH